MISTVKKVNTFNPFVILDFYDKFENHEENKDLDSSENFATKAHG